MTRYDVLIHRLNALPFSKTVPREMAMNLLEEIRLRDKLISDFRTFLLSWNASLPGQASQEHKQRWERERASLLKSVAETLEGQSGGSEAQS